LQGGRYPYVYVDGIYLRRNWGGEYEKVPSSCIMRWRYKGTRHGSGEPWRCGSVSQF